jgi:NAD(P)-dependent dehydrogenase (short-subunit alcohol dehydrogenase family)
MNSTLQRLAGCAAVGIAGTVALRAWVRHSRKISYRNRVVLITGGSRGLGLVMARQLAQEGARLAICARDSDELSRAEAELRQAHVDVFARVCDVTRQEDVIRLVDDVQAVLGPIDVLINNAGVVCVGPIETMTIEDYHLAMQTHFWGPLFAIQRVLPTMKRRRQGRIVNIASIGGKLAVPHLLAYSASKFALVGLSQGLRVELAKDGILVTTVCPGMMRTGSPRQGLFKGQHQAEYAWFSISDSLPLISIQAERAARQILNACRYGEAESIISLPASIVARLNALAPEMTADVLSLADRLLPRPNGSLQPKKGSESQSAWSPSLLTTLNERAARRNNELKPSEEN